MDTKTVYRAFLVLFLGGVFLSAPLQGESSSTWADDFKKGELDSKKWQKTESGDFRKNAVDVVKQGSGERSDFALRLMADTIGTDDKTVKFVGARSTAAFDLAQGLEVSLDLDWNKQANGSYLSAGFYLCPTETGGNPMTEPDWIRVEYVGVPPGKNARLTVSASEKGRVRWLHTEGWPGENKAGRVIGIQRLSLNVENGELVLVENGTEVFKAGRVPADFEKGFLYLQMSSHSNYPEREVFFDNIRIRSGSSG